MSISGILPYIQIGLSLLLIGGILLQRSEAGLGSAFGADGGGAGNFERRGAEKTMFRITVIIGILFVISAFVALVLG
jgi:protein translocase SecG subunit